MTAATVTRQAVTRTAADNGWTVEADGPFVYVAKGDWTGVIAFPVDDPWTQPLTGASFAHVKSGTITLGRNALDEIIDTLTYLGA